MQKIVSQTSSRYGVTPATAYHLAQWPRPERAWQVHVEQGVRLVKEGVRPVDQRLRVVDNVRAFQRKAFALLINAFAVLINAFLS
jgi:hypothetical protein